MKISLSSPLFVIGVLFLELAFGGTRAAGQNYTFSHLAGSTVGGQGSADGNGAAAQFNSPRGLAVDSAGNVYVADLENHTIRKITAAGDVTTFAGKAGVSGYLDGTGTAARFNQPEGVAVDRAGNVYVADSSNMVVRKITSAGEVTTLAGTPGIWGNVDGAGTTAQFGGLTSLTVDSTGIVYVTDSAHHTIRKITPAGDVTTLAGTADQNGSADGVGTAAQFSYLIGITADSSGNVYVTDTFNEDVRKITPAGVVTTPIGMPLGWGSADGTGSNARFISPEGLAMDSLGNIYVADTGNGTIRKITPARVVTTFAGKAGVFGSADGTGSAASFANPMGLAVDSSGNVYVADSSNSTIRKITPAGVVTTFAGLVAQHGSADGTGTAAKFYGPSGTVVDRAGNLYVADGSNSTIRKITPVGVVSTFAGAAGQYGSADGTGSAARFSSPSGMAIDSNGNIYVADSSNSTIRKITPAGLVSTVAGLAGQYGSADGTGTEARFNNPAGVAVDSSGNLYVADYSNSTIRKIMPGGIVTTFAGLAGVVGNADGTGTAARFQYALDLAVDNEGNVYVSGRGTVRKITPDGIVTTWVGAVDQPGESIDGTGSVVRFRDPGPLVIDSLGNVYVADNLTIRRITPAGAVSTLAGTAGKAGITDGLGGATLFASPSGIAIDTTGNLYVADAGNGSIRWGALASPALTSATTANGTFGQSFSHTVNFSGALPGYCSVSNLPLGLAYDSNTGVISGIPTSAGSYPVTLSASNGAGTTPATLTMTINKADQPAPSLSSASDFIVGDSYFATAGSGFGAVNWSLGVGSTAAAATIDPSTGAISVKSGGRVVITAQFAGDANHNASPASAEFTVNASAANPALAWGVSRYPYGLPVATPKAIAGGVVSVSCGSRHTLFIQDGGILWGMGPYNNDTSSPSGSFSPFSMPKSIAGDVVAASAGGAHTMYVKTDGTLWGMGDNSYGQLGLGRTDYLPVTSPEAALAAGVTSVASANSHTLFLKSDGTIWGMGDNSYGQLGDGTLTQRTAPVQVATGVEIVAGGTSSYFIKADASLWAMGYNTYGQLGDGTTTNRLSPVQVASGVVSVATNGGSTMFIKNDGTLWAMGRNAGGQLGDGTTTDRSTPVQVATGAASIAVGGTHVMLLKTDGTLWSRGMNDSGQLGDGVMTLTQRLDWGQVATGVASAAAGAQHSAYIMEDGTLRTFGANLSGQLGDSQAQTSYAQLLMDEVVSVGADGPDNNLFVRSDGTLWEENFGQVRQATGVTGAIQAIRGAFWSQTLYLKGDGTLWRKGADGLFVQVASDVVSAKAGAGYYLYLKSDGTLWNSGKVGFTAAPQGQVADHVIDFSAAGYHLLFVKDNHSLWGMGTTWGGFVSGQTSFSQYDATPVQLESNVSAATANSNQNIVIKMDGSLWIRGSGWASYYPASQRDSNVLAATCSNSDAYYLKADGILRSNSGIYSSASPTPAMSVYSVAGGNGIMDWTVFLQSKGTGVAPSVTTSPASVNVSVGALTTLRVIAGGSGPLAYQWFKNGAAVGWAKFDTFRIPYITNNDAGSYTVTVTNSAGSVTSAPAVITVVAAPTVTLQPVNQSALNGGTASFTVAASGTPPYTYKWQFLSRGVGAHWLDLYGYENISGADAATLNIGNLTLSLSGYRYRCIITDAIGSKASASAVLSVTSCSQSPPVISSATSLTFGESYSAASNGGFGAVVWSLGANSTAAGATINSSTGLVGYTSTGSVVIKARFAGDTDHNGSEYTSDFTVTVNKAAQSTVSVNSSMGGTFGSAYTAMATGGSGSGALSWSLGTGSTAPGAAINAATGAVTSSGAGTVVVNVTKAADVNYLVATSADFTITLGKADATVTLGSLTATYDGSAHTSTAITVPASLAINLTYNGSSTAPTNAGSYAVVGTISDINYQGSATGSLVIAKAVPVISWATPAAIAYGTPLSGGQLNAAANTAGSFAYSPAAGAILETGLNILNVDFTPVDTTNYSPGSAQQGLIVNTASGSPIIVTQPVDQNVPTGSPATFVALASGTPTPTYQWLKNGINIGGATSSLYTIPSVTAGDTGNYRVIATNSAGSITSDVAVLALVIIPPGNAIISITVE